MRYRPLPALLAGLALLAWTAQPAFTQDQVRPYPALGGEEAQEAQLFRVTVGGVEVPTIDIGGRFKHLARFAMSGPQTVTIRIADRQPKGVTLRPRRAGIKHILKGGVLRFRMEKPENLYIKFDKHPTLHLLAYPPIEVPTGEKVYDAVEDYHIDPTPTVEALGPIQKALADIAAKGGGTLVFPDGVYDCGLETPKDQRVLSPGSNTTLFLMPGAVIRQMRIVIEDGERIGFAGHGVLDFSEGPGGRQAGCLRANRIEGLAIRDLVSINRSYNWNTRFDQSNQVTIENYKIFGGKDGINPVSSSNVRINEVYIFAVDDCIATKAHGDGGSYENVHVENATLLCFKYGGIKIGTETRAEYIRNITFRNIEIISAARPAIIQVRDGARVSKVVMENVIVDYAGKAAIDFVIGDGRKLRGHIDGVTVRNFVVHHRSKGERIRLAGYDDEFMIRNVTFEGLVIEGKPILKLEDIPQLEEQHTENLTFLPAP